MNLVTFGATATRASTPARSIECCPSAVARGKAGGASLTLCFEAAPDTEVITGAGPGRDPRDKVPMVVVRRRAAKTVFAATHEM